MTHAVALALSPGPDPAILPAAEILLIVGALALVLARWLPPAARRPTAIGAAVALLTGVALTGAGTRWQLLLVFAGGLLAGAGLGAGRLIRRRSGRAGWRARRRLALPGSLACLGLVTGGTVAAVTLPVPVFPAPPGPFPVATTVTQWSDPDREDTATAQAGDLRTVVVQFWYPALPGSPDQRRAQYLGRTREEADIVADGVAGYLGMPALVLDGPTRARTHAVPEAAPAAGRFPIVLFSPGLGGVRTQNTAWAEDLASRGYVVAGVDHPYDSAAVVLTDGRTVPTRVAASGDRTEDARRSLGWTTVRASDLSFVLTQLGRVDRGEIPGPLTGRLDTARVAATGHSLGGAAAMYAAERDPRFTAVINLDGGPNPAQGPLHQPVLALTHAVADRADAEYIAALSKVLDGGTATGYRLTVPGSAHLTFTDAPLYLPPVAALTGSLSRTPAVRMTTDTCAAFLDATLRRQPVDLPAALSRHGELRVHPPAGRP